MLRSVHESRFQTVEGTGGVPGQLNHSLDEWASGHGWYAIEAKARPPGDGEFQVIMGRRVVERTFAWLGRCRIHGRDYERRADSTQDAGADQHDPADAEPSRRGEVRIAVPLSQTRLQDRCPRFMVQTVSGFTGC
jgi:hypothetical protein